MLVGVADAEIPRAADGSDKADYWVNKIGGSPVTQRTPTYTPTHCTVPFSHLFRFCLVFAPSPHCAQRYVTPP